MGGDAGVRTSAVGRTAKGACVARRLVSITTVALLAAACAGKPPQPPAPPWESAVARDAPRTGKIYDLGAGSMVSSDALIARLAQADFVLLGERHDNPDHHRLQAWIVERLVARGRAYAVAFEMIDADQADKLAAYLAVSPKDAEGLGMALDWDKSGWPAWSDYSPIAQAAIDREMPILAANLSAGVAMSIAKGDRVTLPPGLYEQLQLGRPADRTADGTILAAHATEIAAAHCGLLPARSLAPFALAQYARDAHMARVMTDHRPAGGGVILVAGTGHVRTDRGVPHHLAWFAPDARVVALAFIEAEESAQGASAAPPPAGLPYDFAWFTARVTSDDGCDKLKKQMGLREKALPQN